MAVSHSLAHMLGRARWKVVGMILNGMLDVIWTVLSGTRGRRVGRGRLCVILMHCRGLESVWGVFGEIFDR